MKSDLTDTQVIILDTIGAIMVRTTFRTGTVDPTLQAAVIAVLQENDLSWSDLIEYTAK